MTDYRRLARWFRRMHFDAIDLDLLDVENFYDLSYDEDAEPCGDPWANGACYFYNPEDVPTEVIQRAGFITGMYLDKNVCGIDGGGYSFEDAHWIPLVLEYCKCRGINPNNWLKCYYSEEVK